MSWRLSFCKHCIVLNHYSDFTTYNHWQFVFVVVCYLFGAWIMAIGYWPVAVVIPSIWSAIVYWLLGCACWLLSICFWLVAFGFRAVDDWGICQFCDFACLHFCYLGFDGVCCSAVVSYAATCSLLLFIQWLWIFLFVVIRLRACLLAT